MVRYRKSAPAVSNYTLYTADMPASWDVVVDGVVRGRIWGVVSQYQTRASYQMEFDGERPVRMGYGRLKDAKHEVERQLRGVQS